MPRVTVARETRLGTPVQPQNGGPVGLTSIHPRIHWPATTDAAAPEHSETDQIIIDNFLNTLAEIALAVASRKAGHQHDEHS